LYFLLPTLFSLIHKKALELRKTVSPQNINKLKNLRLGARDSLTSVLEGYAAKAQLKKTFSDLDISCFFSKDTFSTQLKQKVIDVAVFSARELSNIHEGRKILMPRADARDVLLIKKDKWSNISSRASISVLGAATSKQSAIKSFLSWGLPAKINTAEFTAEVQVQEKDPVELLTEFLQFDADSLLIQKCYIDYLFTIDEPEFLQLQKDAREVIDQCYFTVLPTSECPGLAGQGGTALLLDAEDTELEAFLQTVHCAETDLCITREHELTREWQLKGAVDTTVNISSHPFGRVVSLFSEKPHLTNHLLHAEANGTSKTGMPKTNQEKIWPNSIDEVNWFSRQPLQTDWEPSYQDKALWITKDIALPNGWVIAPEQIVWVAGLSTWRKLSSRGVWVHGSAESLGEQIPDLHALLGATKPEWLKLTHDRGYPGDNMQSLATYKLKDSTLEYPDLSDKTHFFWTSGSGFLQAIKLCPSIKNGYHACGPGNTYKILRDNLHDNNKLKVYLGHQNWLSEVLDIRE